MNTSWGCGAVYLTVLHDSASSSSSFRALFLRGFSDACKETQVSKISRSKSLKGQLFLPWWKSGSSLSWVVSSPSQYAAWTSISVIGNDLWHMGHFTPVSLAWQVTGRSGSGDVALSSPPSPKSSISTSSSFFPLSKTSSSELLSNRAENNRRKSGFASFLLAVVHKWIFKIRT